MEKSRVGLTREFLASDGELVLGDIGLKELTSISNVCVEFFPEHLPEVSAE